MTVQKKLAKYCDIRHRRGVSFVDTIFRTLKMFFLRACARSFGVLTTAWCARTGRTVSWVLMSSSLHGSAKIYIYISAAFERAKHRNLFAAKKQSVCCPDANSFLKIDHLLRGAITHWAPSLWVWRQNDCMREMWDYQEDLVSLAVFGPLFCVSCTPSHRSFLARWSKHIVRRLILS